MDLLNFLFPLKIKETNFISYSYFPEDKINSYIFPYGDIYFTCKGIKYKFSQSREKGIITEKYYDRNTIKWKIKGINFCFTWNYYGPRERSYFYFTANGLDVINDLKTNPTINMVFSNMCNSIIECSKALLLKKNEKDKIKRNKEEVQRLKIIKKLSK